MNRRQFISTSAAAAAVISSGSLHADEFGHMKKRVGLIGCGWYGKCDLLRLIQVAPIDVVSICDVDSQMMDAAADLIASRQISKKRPRTYGDYRELLKERDLDIALIATPDHWHALPMIEAVKAGVDVYVQKPTSVDVVESQAMLAAAGKYGRVVQVGTQRRSTPHLIEAKREIVDAGRLGRISHAEVCCYYHMRARGNPPVIDPPAHFNYEMWAGPAPKAPHTKVIHPRSWRAFMEYGNGIVGDMCIHMLDTVRWMLDLGMVHRVSSSGGILMDKESIANISDTQTATFEFEGLNVSWTHRSWGSPPDPEYPWAFFIYGENGTLKGSVQKYEFIPRGKGGKGVKKDVVYELEAFPEDKTEKDLEKHVAPAIRVHMKDFLRCVESRKAPVADIRQGVDSTVACILANLSMDLGRDLRWDQEKGRVIGDDEANKRLARAYRKPWTHPTPESV